LAVDIQIDKRNKPLRIFGLTLVLLGGLAEPRHINYEVLNTTITLLLKF